MEKLGCLRDDFSIAENAEKLARIRNKISKNLEIAHAQSSRKYNLRARNIEFQKGQIVFRKNHVQSDAIKGTNAKFYPKFVKCKINKKLGSSLYEVIDLKGKIIGKYHASDIRP